MGQIGAARRYPDLEQSAKRTQEGKGHPGLPGVKADAFQMSPDKDFKINRELERRIAEVFKEMKCTHDGKPIFVLGWRMYPNLDNKEYWEDRSAAHICSCGCAGVAGTS
jgi:hypothetical protein